MLSTAFLLSSELIFVLSFLWYYKIEAFWLRKSKITKWGVTISYLTYRFCRALFTMLPCSFSDEYIYVTYTLISKTSIISLSKFIRYLYTWTISTQLPAARATATYIGWPLPHTRHPTTAGRATRVDRPRNTLPGYCQLSRILQLKIVKCS